MNKRDIISSSVTGITAGFIAWRLFDFLGISVSIPGGIGTVSNGWLVVIVPMLWNLGVATGYLLSRWFGFFAQFGKYVAVGLTNAAVDFGILNLFIAYFAVEAGGTRYAAAKGVAVFCATIHSYVWNKYWSFDAGSTRSKREFFNFILVVALAALVNIAVATGIVTYIDPLFGSSATAWANVGAVAGSAAALLLSFVGFRLVFRTGDKNGNVSTTTNPLSKIPSQNL